MSEADLEQTTISDKRVLEGDTKELARQISSLDRESFRALEALSLNSFENALNAFDEFLGSILIFEGANSFVKAANALDIASKAFLTIDANHDFVMTKAELEGYLAGCPSNDIASPLSWLISNFAVLQSLSFFLDGITRHEIEAARDLFHGLNYLQANLDKIGGTKRGGVSEKAVLKYLHKNIGQLEIHDYRGLKGLAKYLGRLAPVCWKAKTSEGA